MSDILTIGPLMDKEIAEQVMGWTWKELDNGERGLVQERRPGYFVAGVLQNGNSTKYTDNLPHYSTDPQEAFLVMEELFKMGWDVGLHFTHDPYFEMECELSKPMERDSIVFHAPHIEEAICRAALKAVGAKVTP